jgi:hypothetical protein
VVSHDAVERRHEPDVRHRTRRACVCAAERGAVHSGGSPGAQASDALLRAMKNSSVILASLLAAASAACAPLPPPPLPAVSVQPAAAPPPAPAPEPAAPPPSPEPATLRYELLGTIPAADTDVLRLFALDHHLAVAFGGSEADAHPRILIHDGKKMITDTPLAVPDKASYVLEMAGDWPRRIDLVVAGRQPVGEPYRERLGYRFTHGRWAEQKVGWYLGALDGRVVTVERQRGRTTTRVLRGKPLPAFSFTPRATGPCAGDRSATDVELSPRIFVSRGAGGFASVGETCDHLLGVEIFPSGGGPGTVHLAEGAVWGPIVWSTLHVAARGSEIWAVQSQEIRRFDGLAWEKIPARGAARPRAGGRRPRPSEPLPVDHVAARRGRRRRRRDRGDRGLLVGDAGRAQPDLPVEPELPPLRRRPRRW